MSDYPNDYRGREPRQRPDSERQPSRPDRERLSPDRERRSPDRERQSTDRDRPLSERDRQSSRPDRDRQPSRPDREYQPSRPHTEHQSAWSGPSDNSDGIFAGLKGISAGSKLKTTLLVILLSVCMLSNTVYAGARAVFSKINIVESVPTETVTPPPEEIEDIKEEMGSDEMDTSDLIISDKDVEVILLVGSDHSVDHGAARSDTIMLVAIDRIHQKTKIISIMRDLYAPIAGTKGSNKINFAYYYDSSSGNMDLRCTRATLEKCFGVAIDHFAVIDFKMFVAFIEALGEIEVEMSDAEAKYMDDNGRWRQPRYMGSRKGGVYSLNGWESLYYVRMRKTGNGDYERTERQRRFLGNVLDKAKSMSYPQMVKALTTILPYITTDLSENEIFGYCFDAPRLLKYEIVQFRVPIDGAHKMGWATIGSTNVSILITNYTFLAQATTDFVYNDDMTYTYEGARASGVALPTVTTISFETQTETTAAETTPPPETTTASTAAEPPASPPEEPPANP